MNTTQTKQEFESKLQELEALMTGFWLTDLANFSAFFFQWIPNINWIGFYLKKSDRLVLGPFAGKTACVEIAFTRGVCGKAFSEAKPILVADVHEFPGHISCDPASRSELVIPFYLEGKLVGVLDIDSPQLDRFSEADLLFFTSALEIASSKIKNWPGI